MARLSWKAWSWSIDRKLPLLVSVVLVGVVLALSGAAYRESRRSARLVASTRLARATAELAALFQRSTLQRLSETRGLASDAGVRELLGSGGSRGRAAALQGVRRVAAESATNVAVELWDATGRLLLRSGDPALAAVPPLPPAPDSVVIGPLQIARDTVLHYQVRGAVRQDGRVVGQVVQVRRISTSAQARQTIGQLIGGDIVLLLGNASGEPWTDLAGVIPTPPAAARARTDPTEYRRGNEWALGAAAPVRGTPWMVLVELSRRQVFAPVQAYLARMALIAGVLVLVGTLVAWHVSRRITSPLRGLTMAAEGIAAGDLSQRVDVPGADELGRLARSFNTMTEHVARAQQRLEEQVAERTRALRESETRLRAVTETAHDAIIAANTAGDIVYWNPGAARTFGYAADEVLGRALTLLMPARYHEDHLRGIRRYAETNEAHVVGRTVELEGRRKDGTEFPIELSLAAAHTDGGIAFTGVIRDITERKRIEQALRDTNAELEAFSYSVSHDLRAPLRAIHGFARILLEDHGPALDPEAQRLLGVIDDNTKRMGQLIDDLLALSRLGRKELDTARVNMTDLVRTVADDLRRGEGDRALEIGIDPLPPVQGDRELLRQVVANLLQNAVKFTRGRSPTRIQVGHRADGLENVYYVKDNGAGFDQRYAGKLFGVFQRLHRADEFEGTGVGLAIVQRIVHRHGGRVWAEGVVDQGATFYFSLPGAAAS